jgi:flagellar basal-body rod modification protein FlgD
MFIDSNYLYSSTLQANQNREISKELDKDAFMKILLTQLKYQDPSAPVDDKEMITQLSMLTSTEQMANMSKSFQEMVESQMSLYKVQTAGLIGKYAVVENNSISLSDGKASSLIYSLEEDTPVYLEIYNSEGELVKYEELGTKTAGVHGYQWDGRNGSGTKVLDGEYTYVLYKLKGTEKVQINGLDGGKIEAVQFAGNEMFVIVNGEKFPISAIKEITEEPTDPVTD